MAENKLAEKTVESKPADNRTNRDLETREKVERPRSWAPPRYCLTRCLNQGILSVGFVFLP